MKNFLITSTSVFTLVIGSLAHAQSKSTEDWSRRGAFVNPETANEKIVESWEGGEWKKEGIRGSFRFVITEYKAGREKLYLQWLTTDGEAAYSMSVVELNARPEYDLTMPECLDEKCLTLRVKAHHYYEDKPRQFSIVLDGLGSYAFSF